MADKLVMFAGAGHTSVLYTNQLNTANMRYYGDRMKTVRILINTPASLVGPWNSFSGAGRAGFPTS
jgi:acetaldehyde dehydrogenase/alcohol dehydrogenase